MDTALYIKTFKKKGLSLESWVLWQKWPYDNDFNFVTTDAFDEWGEWFDTDWDIISEVHPGLDYDKFWDEMTDIRTFISREVWELIDYVVAEP